MRDVIHQLVEFWTSGKPGAMLRPATEKLGESHAYRATTDLLWWLRRRALGRAPERLIRKNARHWEHVRPFIAGVPELSDLLFTGDRQVGFRDEISPQEVSELVQYVAEHAFLGGGNCVFVRPEWQNHGTRKRERKQQKKPPRKTDG